MKIYFDNAATTLPLKGVANEFFGNPSSSHEMGIAAERNLSDSRKKIAQIFNCDPSEITFTSGGTESNNLALTGFALANQRKDVTLLAQPWEHPSILEPLKFIEAHKLANVLLAPHERWHNCKSQICLAAISHVNHETGKVNDIHAIANSLKKFHPHSTIFVDGVQSFCKEITGLRNIDMYSFSGHKCHGPTGTGGLVIQNVRLLPLLYGGGQEKKLRPGTENVNGIMQMANAAVQLHKKLLENYKHVTLIRNILLELAFELPNVTLNSGLPSSPYILNMSFLGIKGETLVHLLSEKGVYVSMGAACRSRKKTKSTLEKMGFSQEIANSAIRLSFSHLNTLEEAYAAKTIITECVNQLRRVLGS